MYIPLYVKSNYSLLSSLVKIEDLIEYAINNNIKALALTDTNMYKTLEFYKLCIKNSIKPIIGLEIEVDSFKILLYAKDYNGYQKLIKLSTISSEREILFTDISDLSNLIVIIPYKSKSIYNYLISDDKYIGYSNKNEEYVITKEFDNIVFINEVLSIYESDIKYLKYLYMIRDNKTLSDDIHYIFDNNYIISDIEEFSSKKGIDNTFKISDLCDLKMPKYELLLPIYDVGDKQITQEEYLTRLAFVGLEKRLNNNVSDIYKNRLMYEINVIKKMGFCNYFLVVFDFVRYAKKNNILVGPGRGSAAGSLTSYAIGITDIDPIKYDLLFERFLNPERVTMPDIDIDFPDLYRDDVINYVTKKYGYKNVAGIITFGTLAVKQAIRDVSKILNVPNYLVDLLNKNIPSVTKDKLKDFYDKDINFREMINGDKKLTLMYEIAQVIEGFPRHTSVHAAGIIMSDKELDNYIPLQKSGDMYLSCYTSEYLEEIGLLKMDFLGLKNLTTIMRIIDDIKKHEGITIDFSNILLEDEGAINIFKNADTLGIFQFESDGMRNFISRLKPSNLEDIFSSIALYRPGPSINIDSYIRRKHNLEKVEYLSPSLEPILKNTYGIVVYQEQILQIARVLAGYSYGEADILRRAMSKKKMDVLVKEEDKFIKESIKRGYSEKVSKDIYSLILNFANYGFNRSHSVAYSIIAYKMAYLKAHFPKYFYSNLLSSVINIDTKTKEYMLEMRKKSIKILKPNINISTNLYKVEDDGVYFPLSNIRNVGTVVCSDILEIRKDGKFVDIFDFFIRCRRRSITRKVMESLIYSSAFSPFGYNIKTLIHNLDSILNYVELVDGISMQLLTFEKPDIEIMEEYSNDFLISKEKELFGIYLSTHPTTTYKAKYNDISNLSDISKLFNKVITTIIIVDRIKKITTKSGSKMAFLDGSDEYNQISYTVFPKLYEKININVGDILKVKGRVEKRFDKYQIIVNDIEILKN